MELTSSLVVKALIHSCSQRDYISLQNVSGPVRVEEIINTNDVQIVFGFGNSPDGITTIENATSEQVFQSLINTENSTVHVY